MNLQMQRMRMLTKFKSVQTLVYPGRKAELLQCT